MPPTLAKPDIDYLDINRLFLDPLNPRLKPRGEDYTQAEIINFMLDKGNVIELMNSIGTSDFYAAEPLLVTPIREGESDWSSEEERFYVVEGNRRLTAAKLILEPHLASTRFASVEAAAKEADYRPVLLPSMIFDYGDQIIDYLGYRHITGIKPWGSLEKARYLERLRQAHPEARFKELAKIIGSRADYVAKLLTALAIYQVVEREDFFRLRGVDASSVSFSLITTALSYSGLLSFLGLESAKDPSLEGLEVESLGELTAWMFQKDTEGQTRLGDSRRLEDLNHVVQKAEALGAFRAGRSLEDAVLLTGAPTEIFRTALADVLQRLKDARDYLHLATDLNKSDLDMLGEARQIARILQSAMHEQLLFDEDS